MKKINSILLALLIVMSALAGALASVSAVSDTALQARGGAASTVASESSKTTEEAIDVEKLLSEEVTEEEIEEAIREMDEAHRYKRLGFTKIWKGQGWIENEEEGYLIDGFWLVHGVATITADSETAESNQNKFWAMGRLKIGNTGMYKLIKVSETADIAESIETTGSVTFQVVPLTAKITTVDSVESESIGTLVLTKQNQYDELTTWNGRLTFESGKFRGNWDVELGTNIRVVRTQAAVAAKVQTSVGQPESAESLELDAEGNIPPGQLREKNVQPLWKRIFFWWG